MRACAWIFFGWFSVGFLKNRGTARKPLFHLFRAVRCQIRFSGEEQTGGQRPVAIAELVALICDGISNWSARGNFGMRRRAVAGFFVVVVWRICDLRDRS